MRRTLAGVHRIPLPQDVQVGMPHEFQGDQGGWRLDQEQHSNVQHAHGAQRAPPLFQAGGFGTIGAGAAQAHVPLQEQPLTPFIRRSLYTTGLEPCKCEGRAGQAAQLLQLRQAGTGAQPRQASSTGGNGAAAALCRARARRCADLCMLEQQGQRHAVERRQRRGGQPVVCRRAAPYHGGNAFHVHRVDMQERLLHVCKADCPRRPHRSCNVPSSATS